jgi:hypothetical protein
MPTGKRLPSGADPPPLAVGAKAEVGLDRHASLQPADAGVFAVGARGPRVGRGAIVHERADVGHHLRLPAGKMPNKRLVTPLICHDDCSMPTDREKNS